MPNYIITEYDTIVSTYRIVAIDKQDAINKIANGDLIQRAVYRANGRKKDRVKKKYIAREIINGKKKIQVICLPTKNKATTTSKIFCTPTRTRANEIHKIL